MGSGGKVSRVLFGALVFVGVIWFLLVGILAIHATEETIMVTRVPSTGKFELWKLIARQRHVVHKDLNLNYVSKRRVPNGPDPIHNSEIETTTWPSLSVEKLQRWQQKQAYQISWKSPI